MQEPQTSRTIGRPTRHPELPDIQYHGTAWRPSSECGLLYYVDNRRRPLVGILSFVVLWTPAPPIGHSEVAPACGILGDLAAILKKCALSDRLFCAACAGVGT